MTVFTEGRHAAEFILSEAAGTRSRETVIIASGEGVVAAGSVIGQKRGTVAAVAEGTGNTGNGTLTMHGVTPLGAAAIPGVYRVTLIEAGADSGSFLVEDPNGVSIGVANVGSAFAGDHVQFTIADGATDFVAGDLFTITVTESAAGEWVVSSAEAVDGSQNAKGITLYAVDATSAAVAVAAIRRDAEVNGHILTYHADRDQSSEKLAANADLAAMGIIVR